MMGIQFPPGVSQKKQDFIRAFYATSDDPDAVDKYLAFLTEDVDFVMGINAMQGHAAVRKMRESMWGGVKTRKHTPQRVYSADDSSSQLMLHGTVDYGLANGKSVDSVGWAALMIFSDSAEQLKMSRYQVWIDMAPLQNALKADA